MKNVRLIDKNDDHKECSICGKDFPISFFTKDSSRADGLETRCPPCNNVRYQEIDFRKRLIHLVMHGSINYEFSENLRSTLQPGEEGDHVISVLCGGTNTKENFQAKPGKKNREKGMSIEYDNPKSQQVMKVINERCDELGILTKGGRIFSLAFLNSIMKNNIYNNSTFLDRSPNLELLDNALKKENLHIDYSGRCPKFKYGYIEIPLDSGW